MTLVRSLVVVVLLLFLRLLYGPLDITWATAFLAEEDHATYIRTLSVVMDARAASLALVGEIRVPTEESSVDASKVNFAGKNPGKENAITVTLIPRWQRLLEGKLSIKKMAILVHSIELHSLLALVSDNDPSDNQPLSSLADRWDEIIAWMISVLPALQAEGAMKVSIVVPEVIVTAPEKGAGPVVIRDIMLSLKNLRIQDQKIAISLDLEKTVKIKDGHGLNLGLNGGRIEAVLGRGSQDVAVDVATGGAILADINLNDFTIDNSIFSGSLEVRLEGETLNLSATVQSKNPITFKNLEKLWSRRVAANAREWVVNNVKQAEIQDLSLNMNMVFGGDQGPILKALTGGFGIEDVTMSYYGSLPLFKGMNAVCEFSDKDMVFRINKASLPGVDVTGGSVHIAGLDEPDQTITIKAAIQGPVPKVLHIINSEPLFLLKKAKMRSEDFSGDTNGLVTISFPLLKDVLLKDVALDVKGDFKDARLLRPPVKLPFQIGHLKGNYHATQDLLVVASQGKVEGHNFEGEWRYFFSPPNGRAKQAAELLPHPEMIFDITGNGTLSLVQKLGVDFSPYVKGDGVLPYRLRFSLYEKQKKRVTPGKKNIEKSSSVTSAPGGDEVQLSIDTSRLNIWLPWVGWRQKPVQDDFSKSPQYSSSLQLVWQISDQTFGEDIKNAKATGLGALIKKKAKLPSSLTKGFSKKNIGSKTVNDPADHDHNIQFAFSVFENTHVSPHPSPSQYLRGSAKVVQGALEGLAMGESWINGTYLARAALHRLGKNSWKASVAADTLNLVPVMAELRDDGASDGSMSNAQHQSMQSTSLEHQRGSKAEIRGGLSLDLLLVANAMHTSKLEFPLGKTQLQLRIIEGEVTDAHVVANYLNGQATAHFSDEPATTAYLNLHATNAGYLLSSFDILQQAYGGELTMHAKKPKVKTVGVPSKGMRGTNEDVDSWQGTLMLHNFIIQKAPAMARLLSLVSVAGLSNLLNEKEGLFFDSLEIEGRLRQDHLTLDTIKATSPSLGLLARGTVILKPTPTLELKGTLTPFNFINGLVSYIPLVGQILAGDQGEGVFSFAFSVAGDVASPKVEVNPLSVLAPGVLRKIF